MRYTMARSVRLRQSTGDRLEEIVGAADIEITFMLPAKLAVGRSSAGGTANRNGDIGAILPLKRAIGRGDLLASASAPVAL